MNKEYSQVVIGALLSGLIIPFGQIFLNFGFSLFEIVTLPFLFVLVLLLPLMIWKKEYRMRRRLLPLLVLYGLIDLLSVSTEFGAVLLKTPVAVVVLLLYTQPLWTVLINWGFMKEKIRKVDVFACILVLVGAIILINPFNRGGIGSIWGIIVALLGGVFLSLWIIFGSLASTKGSHPIATKFGEILFMLIMLAIIYPIVNLFIADARVMAFTLNWSFEVWMYILFFAVFVQILSHVLLYSGMRKVSSIHAGIIMLLEPVSAAVLAYFLFGQVITWNIVVGGILILISNYLVIKK